MISLHLGITNPWYKENFKNLACFSGKITTNKAWEFEVCRYAYDIAKFSFAWSFRKDHAGPELELCLLGYSASIKIYDTRHWDRENNCWEIYAD